DIDNLPIGSKRADVILSNCVLNLVPDKVKVFSEIYRVLKAGGHFSISDIVLEGALPDKLKKAAEFYAGCVSGAIQKNIYLSLIKNAGFANLTIQKEKQIHIPDDILLEYLSNEELDQFKKSSVGIYSVTVYAEKPCCDPNTGCR
ncbi:MAG: methyltransferase domain-containing protein, partial [Flavisolibacter sp.]|nr:methyltransferase domain-containing protein [Flavisolibacter sp.]